MLGPKQTGPATPAGGCAWVRCPAGQRRRTRSNWVTFSWIGGMSHICTGVNPSSGAASSSGCPHVEHSGGPTRSTWSTWSEGSSPEPSRPVWPPGLRVVDRSRCDAAFRRLALAARGTELGGRKEFELSIDSRRRSQPVDQLALRVDQLVLDLRPVDNSAFSATGPTERSARWHSSTIW